MKTSHIFWIILIFNLIGFINAVEPKIDIEKHLKNFESIRQPMPPFDTAWLEARKYINESFTSMGLIVTMQEFNTTIAFHNNVVEEINGVNIIGESLSSTPDAPVIVVGSYYDSTNETRSSLLQTGASMASLLETASFFLQLKSDGNFRQKITILFVAFDLNAMNYNPITPGKCGVFHFTNSWLSEYLGKRNFIGAIILDSIGSINLQKNTQYLTPDFNKPFPFGYLGIKNRKYKANFLGMVTKNDLKTKELGKRFRTIYQKEYSVKESFRLEVLGHIKRKDLSMEMKNQISQMPHIDFWNHETPYPAILLTDLGKQRTDFDELCDRNCTATQFWSGLREKFVLATTASIVSMLIDYQEVEESPVSTPPTPAGSNRPPFCDHVVFAAATLVILLNLLKE